MKLISGLVSSPSFFFCKRKPPAQKVRFTVMPDKEFYTKKIAIGETFCGEKLIAFPRVFHFEGNMKKTNLVYDPTTYAAFHWECPIGEKRTKIMKLDIRWEQRKINFGQNMHLTYTAPFTASGNSVKISDESMGLT